MNEEKQLVVKYNSSVVGYLKYVNGKIAFQYDEKWLENGFSISPFSLKLDKKIYINSKNNFHGLYGVFHDSLPDGWGIVLMTRKLAKEGINYEKLDPLTKLSLIGKSGLGAFEYEPSQAMKEESSYDLDYLAEEARLVLETEEYTGGLDSLLSLGGSSGGSRPKAHIKHENADWIVKFPCYLDPKEIGEKEYQTNLLAKKCGINVNECKLFPSNKCKGYFGAKRFDRDGDKKVHMISLSSLLETSHTLPNLDYEHLFMVIQALKCDEEDLLEAYRRMCFNVLIGNKDDHGKNFAFLYSEKEQKYKLSPAYDLTSTPNIAEHEMSVLGKGNPSKEDLIAIGKNVHLSLETMNRIISSIEKNI